jgi:glycosyltransferase involved in cell wall biosynthesis
MGTHDMEVIVVDQGAHEARIQISELPSFVRVFVSDTPNASLARNIGMREAQGEIVLFLDDDVRIPNRNFLNNHLRHYDDRSVPGVYGQVLEVAEAPTDDPDPKVIETDWGWMKLPANYARPCRTRNGASNNLSVRKDWAVAVGGMDAWFEKGARREETEFNLRFTKQYGPLVFDPQAGLTHLSADGGSRSWGHVTHVVPMHHIIGHWYFFLRCAFDRTLGAHGLLMELRHIAISLLKNPQVDRNPFTLLWNTIRTAWGLGIAFTSLIRGPLRIDTLDPVGYREIMVERVIE